MDDHLNDDQKIAANTMAVEGNGPFLHKRTVAFTSTVAGEPQVGSGTLVEIDNRLLVATASHTILRKPHGRYSFVPMSTADQEDGVLDIVNFGRSDAQHVDVGFFELVRESALAYLQKEAIPLDKIAVPKALDTERMAYVVGYPADDVNIRKSSELQQFTFEASCYIELPIGIESWPETPRDSPEPDSSVDIFLRWQKGEDLWPFKSSTERTLGRPNGMSGGGVWQGTHRDGELWSPEGLRIVGIQSDWYEAGQYIRAVQIVHWLKLIHSNLGDLRGTIERQFPSVDFEP